METSTIISILAVVFSILGFTFSRKDNSKKGDMELGTFMGEVRTELKLIKESLAEIKNDTKNFDDKMNDLIKEHERRYHNGK